MSSETDRTGAAITGVVVIGRNEGERLSRCLAALRLPCTIVYVDSGSTDDSLARARQHEAHVVPLDMSVPFTAARARNAGFACLMQHVPHVRYVQFVDGDCELIDDWLNTARSFLQQHEDVACVCGRLRERFPEHSVYNRLCDIEWDRPAGEVDACGGIAMMRADAFARSGGFREDLLAGEELELCTRLGALSFKIWRLSAPMAWHDAAMLRFGQWWTRSMRSGFGYAQTMRLHSRGGRLQRRRAASSWIWAAALPLLVVAALLAVGWPGLVLLLAYPAQMWRVARTVHRPWRWRLERGFFLVLGRFPELVGQLRFWSMHRHGARVPPPFDYKS